MKAFIVEVILPDSWTKHDVISAMNVGLTRHYETHEQCGSNRKLESPRGLASGVMMLADLLLRETKL